MLQLYAIIYMQGLVVGVIGPWPNDAMGECVDGAMVMERAAKKHNLQHKYKFVCEFRTERPKLQR